MNKMSKENKIKLLIIGVVMIFLLILILIFADKNKASNTNRSSLENFEVVSEYNLYFFVSNNINNYIQEVSKENVYDLLYNKYIENNNITKENVFSYSLYNNVQNTYRINEIYNYEINSLGMVYYIVGDIYDNYTQDLVKKNCEYIVYFDYQHLTYAVEPVEKFDEEKFISNADKDLTIPNNEHNSYEGINLINEDDICMIYLSDYLLMDPDKKTDITSNFSKKEQLEEYIKNNEFTSTLKSCSHDSNNQTYTIIDSNDNKYKFYEKGIMNYTVTILK